MKLFSTALASVLSLAVTTSAFATSNAAITASKNTVSAVNRVLAKTLTAADAMIRLSGTSIQFTFLPLSTTDQNPNYITSVSQASTTGVSGMIFYSAAIKITLASTNSVPLFLAGKTLTFSLNPNSKDNIGLASWQCTGSTTDGVAGINPTAVPNNLVTGNPNVTGTTDFTSHLSFTADSSSTINNMTCIFS